VTDFRFGRFEIDSRTRELRKDGVRLRLQDQPFALLALMLDRPGELLTRDELRDRLWPDGTFVDFEHGLNAAIKRLRAVLGDSAERMGYANRIMTWLAGGQGEADLSYVYLPLVLGGVVVNQIVTNKDDNPWIMILQLREAYRGRARLVTGEAAAIFKMMDALLDQAEDTLRRSRIPRP